MDSNRMSRVEEYVKKQLSKDSSGHDFYHAIRVRNNAKKIAASEEVNALICEIAALVHDVIDEKLFANPDQELAKLILFLESIHLTKEEIDHIVQIITSMSYKGGTNNATLTLEGQVVQDADRLDAIGAIGIARTCAYAGKKGNLIYNPEVKYREEMTYEEYRNNESTAINHFYEKLLKLKDLMNTTTAKSMAELRHQYMVDFLEQFYSEWE